MSKQKRQEAWNACMGVSWDSLDEEIPSSSIGGTIPKSLRGGRLLSNGPGWTKIGGRTAHPFDGHGYIRSFFFDEKGSCHLRGRFVETPSYKRERAAGTLVVRGLATNPSAQFWKNIKAGGEPRHVANTTIVRWKDKLLAGWEGGAPYALDAATLATQGEEHFGGALAGQATLAHLRHDAAADRLVACSPKMGRHTGFTFREINAEGKAVVERTAQISGMVFAHDFAITPNWYILGGNPLRLKVGEFLKSYMGFSTLFQAIATDASQGGALYLISRLRDGEVKKVDLPHGAWVIHFGNAFERGGEVIVDACAFQRFDFGGEFGYTGPDTSFDPTLPDQREPQRLYRLSLPLDGRPARCEQYTAYGIDFPRFHPDHEGRETPALYGATRSDTRHSDPFDSVIRVDLCDPERPAALWSAPEDVFVGEPIFVPDVQGDGAQGHVLVLASWGLARKSELLIFDALRLGAGPVATIPLPLLPIAFHGAWDPPKTDGRK